MKEAARVSFLVPRLKPLQVIAWRYLQLPLWQWGAGNVYLLVLSSWKVNIAKKTSGVMAQTYLQPHYGHGFFDNIYLSAWQHKEVNIAGTPLPKWEL